MNAVLLSTDSDETAILSLVLQRAGFAARATTSIDQINLIWSEQPVDLVILALPESPPLDQVRQIRSQAAVPVVVVTTAASEEAQIDLLEAGVDLTVLRPYSARMLIAQLRALMRRSAGLQFFSLPILSQGDISLDPSARTVQVDGGTTKRLTQLEFRLLYTLILNAGQVIPTEVLVEHVWGYSGEGDRTLVRGLVKRLRSKIEPDPANPRYIITEPGVGYRILASK